MGNILLYCLLACGYLLLAWLAWQAQARYTEYSTSTPQLSPPLSCWQRSVLLLCLLAHGYLLYTQIFTPQGLRFGFAIALSATFWLGNLLYWFESWRLPLQGMAFLLHLLALASALLPLIFMTQSARPVQAVVQFNPWFKWHVVIALAAYGLFTIAALHAILMLLLTRTLHHIVRTTSAWGMLIQRVIQGLPALLSMERILFRTLMAGFVLLSLTLLSGIAFSDALFGKPFTWDHKTVFSLLAWANFAVLLVGHYCAGWRGRLALHYTLAGFVFLLLAYVGSRFVLEILLQRTT